MIIYNVTIMVTWAIQEDWVKWMKGTHIPEVMDTECFTRNQFVKLLEVEEADGPTYAVQYYANSKADYNRYIELYSQQLRQQGFDKWGDQFIALRSLMQVVN
jgi:Domain of unknown function (DUF4286)